MIEIKEDRNQKFRRIAELRINRITDTLALIKNLSNRNNYSYDQNTIEKHFAVLFRSVAVLKANFDHGVSSKIPPLDSVPKEPEESEALRFERLITNRINTVIKDINLISNLTNKGNYKYTETEVQKMIDHLGVNILILKEIFLYETFLYETKNKKFEF